MTIDIAAIRSRAAFSADPFHEQDVNDLLAELKRLRDLPCGSCHPCTNYADETWRAANRKPPHVITWDDTQTELKLLRTLAEATQRVIDAGDMDWTGCDVDVDRIQGDAHAALRAAYEAHRQEMNSRWPDATEAEVA